MSDPSGAGVRRALALGTAAVQEAQQRAAVEQQAAVEQAVAAERRNWEAAPRRAVDAANVWPERGTGGAVI